jgi:allophanate hydrolase subunit 2
MPASAPMSNVDVDAVMTKLAAGNSQKLHIHSQFEFWRCPWKITARADHVGGTLLTARAILFERDFRAG